MSRSYKSSRFLVGTLYKMYFSSIYPDIKGKNPAAFAFSPMETHSFQVIPTSVNCYITLKISQNNNPDKYGEISGLTRISRLILIYKAVLPKKLYILQEYFISQCTLN